MAEEEAANVSDDLHKEIVELVTKQRELTEAGLTEASDELKRVETALEEKFQIVSDIKVDFAAEVKSREEAEKRIDDLEKEVAQAGMSAKQGDEHIRTKCDDAIETYLRKGNEFFGFDSHEDFVQKNAEELAPLVCQTKNAFALDLVKKSMVEGNNPEGGFFLPAAPMQIIQTKVFESSPIRPFATTVTTNVDEFRYVLDDDEADCNWVGEIDTRGDTDTPQVGEIKIPVHEIFAQPKASQRMIDDAGFDLEGWLTGKVSNRFGRKESTAFVAGDGALMPKGFLDYPASADEDVYERGTVGQLTSGTNDAVEGDDFKGLVGLLKEDYQNNARFGMKRSTWTATTKLKDSQNRYLFDMISNLRDGDILRLLGKDVVLMNDMPAIADGALSVVYADFLEFYTIVDRMGIRVLRDPFTSKPFVRFYTTKRVGGAVTNYEAGKLLVIQ